MSVLSEERRMEKNGIYMFKFEEGTTGLNFNLVKNEESEVSEDIMAISLCKDREDVEIMVSNEKGKSIVRQI